MDIQKPQLKQNTSSIAWVEIVLNSFGQVKLFKCFRRLRLLCNFRQILTAMKHSEITTRGENSTPTNAIVNFKAVESDDPSENAKAIQIPKSV